LPRHKLQNYLTDESGVTAIEYGLIAAGIGVAIDVEGLLAALRRHLDRHGFSKVQVTQIDEVFQATRLDPTHPWVQHASVQRIVEE
jgi:Flp pilus assembly pilin Flp